MGQQSERAGQAEPSHALRRVVGRLREAAWSDGDPVRALSRGLPGSDLATVLLEVFRRRADRIGPSDVLRRYRGDRFVAPGSVPFADLRRAEDGLLAALPEGFEVLTLAPVLPLGSHSAIAAVDPRNVIATIRAARWRPTRRMAWPWRPLCSAIRSQFAEITDAGAHQRAGLLPRAVLQDLCGL